jgi:hypothetical protein
MMATPAKHMATPHNPKVRRPPAPIALSQTELPSIHHNTPKPKDPLTCILFISPLESSLSSIVLTLWVCVIRMQPHIRTWCCCRPGYAFSLPFLFPHIMQYANTLPWVVSIASQRNSVGCKSRYEAFASKGVLDRKRQGITQAVFDSCTHPTSSVGWTERCGPDHGRRGGRGNQSGADERGGGASIVNRESDEC